ncbi:MAG: hypothetical protein HQM11_16595, partial [SAR324 cluster bacterium]|nr:hypothetical protein [SAR324 cluster bacterium]
KKVFYINEVLRETLIFKFSGAYSLFYFVFFVYFVAKKVPAQLEKFLCEIQAAELRDEKIIVGIALFFGHSSDFSQGGGWTTSITGRTCNPPLPESKAGFVEAGFCQ